MDLNKKSILLARPILWPLAVLVLSLSGISFFPKLSSAINVSLFGVSLNIFAGYHIIFSLICWAAMLTTIVLWPSMNRRKTMFLIGLLGLIARLFLFSQAPSDDVNRYLWEGKILAHGLSPYSYAARTEVQDAAAAFRNADDRYWSNINHPEMTAIYPPLFQVMMGFVAALHYSETCVRILFLFFDLGALFLLLMILEHLGLSLRWAIFYAMNPVILLSFAGHCHQDVTMIFFILAALMLFYQRSWKMMFLCLGLSVQMKYFSLLCLPFFVNKENYQSLWAFAAMAIIPFLPFLASDGYAKVFASFAAFGSEFSFNSFFPAVFAFLMPQHHSVFLILTAIVAGYLYFSQVRSAQSSPVTGCFFGFMLLLVCLPTVHFWYISWLIPFICLRPKLSLIFFSFTIMLSLNTYGTYGATQVWSLPWQLQFLIWLPVAVYLALAARRKWLNRSVKPIQENSRGFSVIIPAKNEELELADAIESIKKQGVQCEVIVVDGGSTDLTATIAVNAGARLIKFDKSFENGGGRGGQIVAGIENSHEDIIVVLHADTRLQPGILKRITTLLLLNPDISSGAIGATFCHSKADLTVLEAANNFRAAFLGISFGDQVQFCRRSSHNTFALFPEIPLMEDVEFSIRSFVSGQQTFLWGNNLVSARKWQNNQRSRAMLIIKLLARYLFERIFANPDPIEFYRKYYLSGNNEKHTG